MRANGYMVSAETSQGVPFELVSAPVQFDGEPGRTSRAPEFNEHADEILEEVGIDAEKAIQLRIDGALA